MIREALIARRRSVCPSQGDRVGACANSELSVASNHSYWRSRTAAGRRPSRRARPHAFPSPSGGAAAPPPRSAARAVLPAHHCPRPRDPFGATCIKRTTARHARSRHPSQSPGIARDGTGAAPRERAEHGRGGLSAVHARDHLRRRGPFSSTGPRWAPQRIVAPGDRSGNAKLRQAIVYCERL